ncbi:hypothetical protein AOQ73_05665 [Bradyrhizobium pachyrhizi]|uniref:hypothetical protein n=1 Tax=Bradyrhizobium pachyrhizi TaxID=280333 RepID=UPI000704AF0C|nr:hypothetical protein [Bradyrhizobium pachyrhizi]KRQ11894.1 hypothetical protein AOQ73_05665 [Bradyrhizobium pachyrhizi]
MTQAVTTGQIYRDTYFDGINGGKQEHRTIRVVEIVGDKVHALTITDVLGNVLAKPRKTRVSLKTLASGYVLKEDAPR